MLRIADANCISLQELMFGFQSCHPDVPCPNSLDWGFSTAFLKAMAQFCRAPAGTLRSLDLRTRLPKAQIAHRISLRVFGMADSLPNTRDAVPRWSARPPLTCLR